ncbi:hypothetical protein ACFCY8_37195 [Streptomyces noursei]
MTGPVNTGGVLLTTVVQPLVVLHAQDADGYRDNATVLALLRRTG